ncbi:AraC family transcriptional regulator [Kaistia dalseonensis]|uniref:AraC-like DNA-binding protein n=1 Tax=Kaistia dalseonensis TaxID=410840 RepID=A0ABU0H3Z9_9HYPH|nr:AraC family transcriptional regulator [Kaistia dalseonensis]MCX5493937.1 AraC family transcriptional regulator [Kaistia dalseonensis]MDQ0436510.1 AraC-like DNA-binding protein [Kaistia dalseonensis]
MSSSLLAGLTAYIESQGGGEGLFPTQMESVHINRSYQARTPIRQIYRPSLCVVAQGAKEILFGNERLYYGAMECLVVSMEMPATGRVIDASPESPYVGVTIDLDVTMLREVLEQLETPPAPPASPRPCVFVGKVDEPLAECVLRLIRMSQTPKAIPILYPSVMRDICYWLLSGPYGGELHSLTSAESNFMRIAKAIYFLRTNFTQTLRVEQMAEVARMSPSSFYQHFKQLTSVSPLQFQKQLRLLESRRLMVADAASVEEAAHKVGYESASQFSREYSRMFGVAPKQDALNYQRLYSQFASRKARTA